MPATRESRETRAARVRERCVRRPRPGAGPWACGRRGRAAAKREGEPQALQPEKARPWTPSSLVFESRPTHTKKLCRYDTLLRER